MKLVLIKDGKEVNLSELSNELIMSVGEQDPKLGFILSLLKLRSLLDSEDEEKSVPNQELEPEECCFACAIEALKEGYRITRRGWNGKGMYLYLVPQYPSVTEIAKEEFGDEVLSYGAYIAMKTVQGNVVPWTASQTDILSEDWLIL